MQKSTMGLFTLAPLPALFFGMPILQALPKALSQQSRKILCITGKSSWSSLNIENSIKKALSQQTDSIDFEHLSGEPSPETINSITHHYKRSVDTVIAIGGGSVIDTGKAVAAMLSELNNAHASCNTKDDNLYDLGVESFLEGVGEITPSGRTLPLIACPTTAGTGSEATKNAVISRVGQKGFKKSLRHENYIPAAAVIDPSLCISCSTETTISSALDAFSQLLESYTSTNANEFTDTLALKGISNIYKALPSVIKYPNDEASRRRLSLAAYYSGITLANAGLGTVHGIAGPLGGRIEIPHGIACAKLIYPVFQRILSNDRQRILKEKLKMIEKETGEIFNTLLEKMHNVSMQVPSLSSYGLTKEIIIELLNSFSNKSAVIPLDKDEIFDLLNKEIS